MPISPEAIKATFTNVEVMTSMVRLLDDVRQYRGSLPLQLCYAKSACRLSKLAGVTFDGRPIPPRSTT